MASPLTISLKKQKGFYGSKISILSPAKINLYLNIIGKYPGNFHRIESIVERISLADRLSIEVRKEPSLQLNSNIKSLETKSNLVFKAIDIIKKRFKLPFGFKVSLDKKIPIGSGLGGGSSNAASTLLALDEILNLNLRREELYRIGAELGSDVNFFLSESKFAFMEGRGEKITSLPLETELRHVVVWPDVSISTRKVYENTAAKLTKFFNNANIMRYALRKADCSLIKENIFNVLEKSALEVSKKLRKAKEYLEDKGFFYLSGSGSAFYSVSSLLLRREDKLTVQKIRKTVPDGWLVFEAQTF